MIGSGIFYLGSYVLERTGYNLGLSLLAWIIGGLISLFGGLWFAELRASIPKAGWRTVYLTKAYHLCIGFLAGFSDWLIAGSGSIAAIAIALPTALRAFVGISDAGIKACAIILILALTIYNCYGVKLSSILQNVSMVAKLIPIILIMCLALLFGKITPDISLGAASEVTNANGINVISMMACSSISLNLWRMSKFKFSCWRSKKS